MNSREKMMRFLSKEECHRLLTALDACPKQSQMQADIVRILLLTGCRRGEILNLRWDEIMGSKLELKDRKTGARTVWLSKKAKALLERQAERQANRPSPYVFASPYSADRPIGSIDKFWVRLRKQAGLDDFRLHDLRHSFASEAVRQGIALPVLSKLLGDSYLAMTIYYAHTDTNEIEAAAERIGFLLYKQLNGEEEIS